MPADKHPAGKRIISAVTALVAVAVVGCAVWIMARGMGLAEGLDFGAGAYYYADIPEFEKVLRDGGFQTRVPLWVHVALFLGWGYLMWRLWIWIDRK